MVPDKGYMVPAKCAATHNDSIGKIFSETSSVITEEESSIVTTHLSRRKQGTRQRFCLMIADYDKRNHPFCWRCKRFYPRKETICQQRINKTKQRGHLTPLFTSYPSLIYICKVYAADRLFKK